MREVKSETSLLEDKPQNNRIDRLRTKQLSGVENGSTTLLQNPAHHFLEKKKSLINGHKESEFDVRPKGNGLESKGRKGFKSRIREGTQLEANSNPHVCCRGRDVRPDPQGEKKRKKSGQKRRK